MVRNHLEKIIKLVLKKLSIPVDVVLVEQAKGENNGDYATNIAMVYAKKIRKDPKELAGEIVKLLEKEDIDFVDKIEIAGPGFINFYLTEDFFIKNIEKIIKEDIEYGKNDIRLGKNIIIEYTQPNPFKPFHIGHLMSNAIGESISRIIEASGASVIRANYQGDIGLHVAKTIWAVNRLDFDVSDIERVGEAYVYGNSQYEESEISKKEIIQINKELYENDNKHKELYGIGRKTSLEHFEKLYKILGTKFDYYFFESETAEKGKQIVENNIGKVFEKSDGAVIFDGEKYGLHKRVFITSNGLPTYEAKEMGLAFLKREKIDYDLSITATAVEQQEYFKVVFKALSLIDNSFEGKLMHLPNGMMQFASGKMSSRKGNIITGESLINSVRKSAQEKIKNTENLSEDISYDVAVAAIKYSILKNGVGKNIIFDEKKALSFEGDSGPYLQYTYARIQSILNKTSITPSVDNPDKVTKLERILQRFPEVVMVANSEYEPSRVATYLVELAQEFNSYYGKYKIIDNGYRLFLVKAVAIVIHNGMHLLGIETPDRM